MGKYIKTICTLLVILSQLMASFAYGQSAETAPKAKVISYPTGQGTQAEAFNNGATNKGSSGDAGTLAAEAVGCSVGQIVGRLAMAGVSSVMSSITGSTDSVTSSLGLSLDQRVPITNKEIESNTADLLNKEAGGGKKSASLADAISSAINGTSWDSIGFCLANASIQYLTQSTVNWINSGFEGNPTFVDNPEKFFQDLADIELAGFVEELGLGFMCSGVAPKVRIALVNDYLNKTGGKTFNDKYKCSFDKIGTNVDAFMNNFQNGGIDAYVEFVYNPANRPSTAYLAAQDELNKRISIKQGQAQFELRTTDFLPFKNCKTVRDPKTGKETKGDCNTYTPGQMIEDQVNNAINSPRNRLEIADEFDEVVAALIDQLIRVALSEMTSIGNNDKKDENNTEELQVEEQQELPIQGGGTNQYKPGQIPAVSVVCNVATTTVMVDEPVLITAVARGGNRQYIYDWLGSSNFPTSTRASSLNISFGTTSDASIVSVRVRAGKTATARCPAIKVVPPVPLEISCAPDDTSVSIGESVTWLSEVSGGTGYYTYEWGGDVSDFSKTSQDNTVSFSTKGTYGATLKVTSGSQVESVSCSKNVKVR